MCAKQLKEQVKQVKKPWKDRHKIKTTWQACETRGKALQRQAQNKQHMASVRQSETCEQAMKRQAENKQHMASVRACETPDQTLHRRQKQ